MTALHVDVVGTPAPQGSKRAFNHRTTGRVVLVEASNKTQKAWRNEVKVAALNALAQAGAPGPVAGPVRVVIEFHMPRPRYHYGTGRNANLLKPGAPRYVDKKPDIDKLVRATLDALTDAAVWLDDSQVAELLVTKTYATGRPSGASLAIAPVDLAASPTPSSVGAPGRCTASAPTVQEALL